MQSLPTVESVLESMSDGFFMLDHAWRFTYVNGVAERVIGRTREDLLGRKLLEAFPELEGTEFVACYRQASAERKPLQFDAPQPAGSHIYRVSVVPTDDGLAVYFRDTSVEQTRAEALQREYAFHRAIEEAVPAGVAVVDREGRQVHVNAAFCRMVGWTEDELVGSLPPFKYWPPEAREQISAALSTTVQGQAPPSGFATVLLKSNGERFPAVITPSAVHGESGEVVGWLASVVDVTDRIRSQQALEESEARLRALFEYSLDGIGVASNGKILAVNPAFARILGYDSADELTGLGILDIVAAEDREMLAERRMRRARGEPEPALYAFHAVRRDGTSIVVENHVSMFEAGGEQYTLVVARDVTERNATAEALHKTENLLRIILDSAPAFIAYLDNDDRYRFNNSTYGEWFGADYQDLVGRHVRDVLGDDVYDSLSPYRDRVHSGQTATYEAAIPFKIGGTRHIRGNYIPDIADDGTIRGYVSVAVDVSAEKKHEQAQDFLANASEILVSTLDLNATMESLAQLVVPRLADWCVIDLVNEDGSLSRVAVGHTDPDKRAWAMDVVKRFPPTMDDPFGPGSVIRTARTEWLPDVDGEALVRAIPNQEYARLIGTLGLSSAIRVALRARGKTVGAITMMLAESGRSYSEDDVRLAEDLARHAAFAVENAQLYNAAQHEIAERKQAEDALRLHASLLNLAHEPIYAWELDGNIMFWNRGAEELYGYTSAEAVGNISHNLLRTVHPDPHPHKPAKPGGLTPFLASGSWLGETRQFTKSGREIAVESRQQLIQLGDQRIVLETNRDVTDRRRHDNEMVALNMQLQRSVRETHHRVKNNLQVITALIDMQLGDGAQVLPINEFARIGQHIRSLASIHDILTHAAGDGQSTEWLSASEMLPKLLDIWRKIAEHHTALHCTVDDAMLTPRQAGGLALIANELVSNAVKAGGSEVEVAFAVDNGTAVLRVSDNGPGFPVGFDARRASNTGLELVESLSSWDLAGSTTYENNPQGGALVTLRFPLNTADAARTRATAISSGDSGAD